MGQGDGFAPGDALRTVEILYVDSESHRRDAMRRLLLNLGARRVHLAENGVEALNVVRGTPCGLVIAEYRMSPAGGPTLIRQIRAIGNYPRALIPTLILSDPVGSEVVRAAFSAGANHFLLKPISPARLYEAIHRSLTDTRPFAIQDGHYVIRPRATPPLAAAQAEPAGNA